jgi:hypothetical protein
VLYSLLLAAVFAGMIGVLVRMAQGGKGPAIEAAATTSVAGASAAVVEPRRREPVLAVAAPFALLALTGTLGVFVPGLLAETLRQATILLGI